MSPPATANPVGLAPPDLRGLLADPDNLLVLALLLLLAREKADKSLIFALAAIILTK